VEHETARRTPRYPFVVDVEVSDLLVGIKIVARTKTLSRCGCGIESALPIAMGTNVSVRLYHQGGEIVALARVLYSGPKSGMGIVFTNVDARNERILELWIAEQVDQPT